MMRCLVKKGTWELQKRQSRGQLKGNRSRTLIRSSLQQSLGIQIETLRRKVVVKGRYEARDIQKDWQDEFRNLMKH